VAAGDRDDGGNPVQLIPELAGELAGETPASSRGALAVDLVPTVDEIRQLYTSFGLRAYEVALVHATWSGGARGAGYARIWSRIVLSPTPRLRNLGSVAEVLRPTGLTEDGDVDVDQISARYTEDDLLGRTPDLTDPDDPRTTPGEREFWWEIVEVRPQNPPTVVRRFFPVGVPELRRGGFQWRVRLTKQDYDRSRTGETEREEAS
jgi:hypothetical protein